MGRTRENPSYREEDEHPTTTPVVPRSPMPCTPVVTRSFSKNTSFRSPSSSAAPRVPSSCKSLVMLSDWWLVPVERAPQGKGLGVAGLELKGQKADRVFYSASIIKRFDTFTLKTVDGIIVRVRGVINIKNTMNSGFPFEFCNHFLIGFPYNWVDLTGEYIGREPSFESLPEKASCDNELSIHLDEFSISQIHSFIASTSDAPPDCRLTNFMNILKRFKSYMSISPAKKVPPDIQICQESPSEHQIKKRNQRHQDTTGYATLLDLDVECHAVDCAEGEFHRNDFDAGAGESSTNITPNIRHVVSPDSLLHLNLKMNALPEKEIDTQKVPSLNKAAEQENDHCSDMSGLVGVSTASCNLKDEKGKLGESVANSLDLGNKNSSNYFPPKDIELSHNGRKSGNDALQGHFAERLRACKAGVSTNCLVREDSDTRDTNPLRVNMNIPFKISAQYDGIKLSKAQTMEKNNHRRSSRIASKIKREVSPSFLLSQDVLNLHHVEGEPSNVCFRVPKDSSSNELNSECPKVLQNMESHSFHATKEPAAQIGPILATKNQTLEMRICSQNEPSSEFVGKEGKHLMMKLKNIKKRQCSEFMNKTLSIHNLTSKGQRTVCEGMPAEENLKEKGSRIATNGISAEENTEVNSGSVSPSVVRKLNYTTCRGRINSAASVVRESQRLSEKGKFSLKRGLGIIDEIPTADATTPVSTMEKLQNKEEGDQTIKRSLDVKKDIGSVPADHTVVNIANDINCKHGSKHARDPATVDALNCNLESSPRELHKNAIPTAILNKKQQIYGCSKGQICTTGGNENEFFKCSVEDASEVDISVDVSVNKDAELYVIKNKCRKKQNNRYVKTEVSTDVQHMKDKASHSSGKTLWKSSYIHVNQSPLTRDKAKKLDLASPDSLNLRRSRSGRLLVPPIATWRQKIIYSADGEITGIVGADMLKYPYIEPPKKKEKLL